MSIEVRTSVRERRRWQSPPYPARRSREVIAVSGWRLGTQRDRRMRCHRIPTRCNFLPPATRGCHPPPENGLWSLNLSLFIGLIYSSSFPRGFHPAQAAPSTPPRADDSAASAPAGRDRGGGRAGAGTDACGTDPAVGLWPTFLPFRRPRSTRLACDSWGVTLSGDRLGGLNHHQPKEGTQYLHDWSWRR